MRRSFRLTISEEVKKAFPGLTIRIVYLEGVRVREYNPELEEFKEKVYEEIRSKYSPEDIKNDPVFRAYRDFYWSMGIDPTKIRPASEALVRRIVRGKSLPRINTLVDAYNLASAISKVPLAAFDADKIFGDTLIVRFSRKNELFYGIGMQEPRQLTGREIVVQDSRNLLAIYPYRDADYSKVTSSTERVLLMVCGAPGVPLKTIMDAEELSVKLIRRFS